MIAAIPNYLFQQAPISFKRASVLPGVVLRPCSGRFANPCEGLTQKLPVSPTFAATHMVMIDEEDYVKQLDVRIHREGKRGKKKTTVLTVKHVELPPHAIWRKVVTAYTEALGAR